MFGVFYGFLDFYRFSLIFEEEKNVFFVLKNFGFFFLQFFGPEQHNKLFFSPLKKPRHKAEALHGSKK